MGTNKRGLSRAYQDSEGIWWYPSKDMSRKCSMHHCITCGKDFPGYPYNPSGSKRWCSDECVRFLCSQCNEEFKPNSSRQKYCSPECKDETRRVNCLECNKSFVPSKNATGNFCTKTCYYDNTTPIGSRLETGHGYILVKVPEGTPGSKKNGTATGKWMLEHRFVMQQYLGRPLNAADH